MAEGFTEWVGVLIGGGTVIPSKDCCCKGGTSQV